MRGFASPMLGAALVAALAADVQAQRTVSWDEVAVEARLDADGRLHVEETQAMVLSGDWNGGERLFTLKAGQGLELHGITRIDPGTGASSPLQRGGLDVVDQYDWSDASTLRWRSRSPSDPPFRDTRLTYVLDYTYTNVLQPRGGNDYELDHDFAFTQRPGAIRRFTLDLALDPVWTPRGEVPTGVVAADLAPGQGYVTRLGLEFRGQGSPAGVDVWGPRVAAAAWKTLLVVPLLVLANAWWRERRAGRFEAPPAPSREWLEENVLSVPAEVIGAAWDEEVGAPEVAAVIARLRAEGKLETRVGRAPRVGPPEMTLKLEAPLGDFHGYEHDLLSALFAGGTIDETSTQAIRERYQGVGFDPAAIIRPEVEKAAETYVGRDVQPKPSWLPATILFWGGVFLLVQGGVPPGDLSPLWPIALFAMIFFAAIGQTIAPTWRRRVDLGVPAALPLLVVAAVPLMLAGAFLRYGGTPGWRGMTQAGAAAVALSVFISVVNGARSRRGPHSIRLRKRLYAVRRFFIDELRKPSPALEDSWFPYAVAFGLEKEVDRWFGRIGGAAPSSRSSTSHESTPSSSGSSSAPSSGPPAFAGGGGSFGGGGATGSWAAALGGLAGGVASPSSGGSGGSSSSGGGGGSSSSSGGGGGGAW